MLDEIIRNLRGYRATGTIIIIPPRIKSIPSLPPAPFSALEPFHSSNVTVLDRLDVPVSATASISIY
jgi:hypothetical protein